MSCKVFESLGDEEAQALPWLLNAPRKQVVLRGGEATRLNARLEEVTADLERQTRAAFEKGLREGEAAARQRLEAESRASLERLSSAISEVPQKRMEALRRAESDAVHLAIEIARRVVHRELSVDPGALAGLIKAALEKLINQEILRVRVHPAIASVLTECIARSGRGQCEVITDAGQPVGGVIFEIGRGALDASVDTQLREIERGLIDEIKNREVRNPA
jgi:flagellar assembly protein FliH